MIAATNRKLALELESDAVALISLAAFTRENCNTLAVSQRQVMPLLLVWQDWAKVVPAPPKNASAPIWAHSVSA